MHVTTIDDYRRELLIMLEAKPDDQELCNQTIQVLEDLCLALGYNLPIVILPEHFHYRDMFVTGRGDTAMCKCGALWPCPSESDLITDPGPTTELGSRCLQHGMLKPHFNCDEPA